MKKNLSNILIRTDFNIYNTMNIFNDEINDIVKIPSYLIQDVLENNKNLLIKFQQVNIALYTTDELKKKLIRVESKIYNGRFRQEDIQYNLVQVKVDKNKIKYKNGKQ